MTTFLGIRTFNLWLGCNVFWNRTDIGRPVFGLVRAGQNEITPPSASGWGRWYVRLFSGFSPLLRTGSLWHRSAIPGSHIPKPISNRWCRHLLMSAGPSLWPLGYHVSEFHLRSADRWIPRIFADPTGTSSWSWMNRGGELRFFFGKGDDEFFALRAVQLHVVSAHQPSIRLMMDCRFPWLPLLMTSDKDVPSTYFHLRSWWVAKSLIMMRNNNGPSTVPWGTPPLVADQSDVTPQTLALWILPVRKSITQFTMDSSMPSWRIFLMSTLWFIQSNALLKSSRRQGFPITIDVGVPAVEHTDEGIDGGITF